MTDQVQRKTNRGVNLSRGGRATLCQLVLANLPTYYMSLFAMPINVASSLERLMRNFFWEGHTRSKINHLVKWAKVTQPQLDGGLGSGLLQNKNMALLPNQGWRFMNEETSLWRQVIRSIHGKESFNWHTVGNSGHSLKPPGLASHEYGGRWSP